MSRVPGFRAIALTVLLHAMPCAAQTAPAPPTSPLAIHVGDADLLIGGFMDATTIMRSTATGNGMSTSFGTIPFTTTPTGAPNPAGNLSETRLTAQNSRLSLQATSRAAGGNMKGYVEVDFLGNTATNLNVTSNANTLRMRLFWAQYTRGRFEFVAGQSWSLLTPNRNGVSPVPGDVFFSQNVDTNYQSGLTWARQAGFRFVAHPSSTLSAGVAVENPQQYVGSAVVLPAAFPANEVDTGAAAVGAASAVPNRYPDVIGKVAFDPRTGKTHQHVEAALLLRGYKTFNPSTSATHTATGTGGSVNVVVEPVPNVRFVAMNFIASGGGRYIANDNIPDVIVTADHSLSLVKTWSTIEGAEVTRGKSLVFGYYSRAQADRRVAVDLNGTTPIGFGVAGSQAANRSVEEATLGVAQTFLRDPKIGGLQLLLQYSRVKRTPFSVPANTPLTARAHIVYASLRYLLP